MSHDSTRFASNHARDVRIKQGRRLPREEMRPG